MNSPRDLTCTGLMKLWFPLWMTWVMMALEGPFLAAVIARLAEPKTNLAAYGVAFAFAIIVEAPVIMMLSAATALVDRAASYRRLRNFTFLLAGVLTAVLAAGVVTPFFDWLTRQAMKLPPEVADHTRTALLILLPWPAAIGYRRFYQGILIRAGLTRRVAYGTVLRLVAMAATALVLALDSRLPGAWIGAAALSAGVCAEAAASRLMAHTAVRRLTRPMGETGEPRGTIGMQCDPDNASEASEVKEAKEASAASAANDDCAAGVAAETDVAGGRGAAAAVPGAPAGVAIVPFTRTDPAGPPAAEPAPGYAEIWRFYYPLALTSTIALAVHPIVTFFLGQSRSALESLAVLPVINGLVFFFRTFGLSYQDVAIKVLGDTPREYPLAVRMAAGLAVAASAGLILIAATPLAEFWLIDVSGLTPDLAAYAVTPLRILSVLPALTVLLSWQRSLLIVTRRTAPVTAASAAEVAGIVLVLLVAVHGLEMVGATAAAVAFLVGRLAGNVTLIPAWRQAAAHMRRLAGVRDQAN
ncbi:MAG: hypothetical protein R6X25_15515 [Candidatus Krumholzibacteriia bacterium]